MAGGLEVLAQDNVNLFWHQANASLGIGTTSPNNGITVSKAAPGGIVRVDSINSSNTAGSSAWLVVSVAGASAGDPVVIYDISGVQNWAMGIDNDQADTFKIASSAALGTFDRLTITTAGVVNIPGSITCPLYSSTSTLTVKTQDKVNAISSSVSIGSGDVTGSSSANSGTVTIESGDASPLSSGSDAAGNSGTVTVATGAGGNGDNGSAAGNSGNLNLKTGSGGGNSAVGSTGGNAGHIILQPGNGGSGTLAQGAGGSTIVRASNSGDIFAVQNSAGTTTHMAVNNTGNVRMGTSASGARLQLGAGTATLPPLMFTAGTNMTSPAAGAVEWDGSKLWITSGSLRKELTFSQWAVVTDFGAKGDGSNDAAAVQAAVTSLTSTGGVVYFPPSLKYGIGSTVTIQSQFPIWLVSHMGGWNNDNVAEQGYIKPIDHLAEGMFKWVKVGTDIDTAGSGGAIGLKIMEPVASKRSYSIHSAIRLENGANFLIRDCEFYYLKGRVFYGGEWANNAYIQRIDVSECGAADHPMIDLRTIANQGYYHISDSELEVNYGDVYLRVPVGGVYLNNVGFEATHTITADQTFVDASEGPLRADNCQFRRNQATHVIIGKASGSNFAPGGSYISNSYFAGETNKTTPTLHVLPTAPYCRFSNLQFIGNGEQVGRQIYIQSDRCQLANIYVQSGGNVDIAGVNCRATNIEAFALNTTQTYCIKIADGGSLIGCHVNGNGSTTAGGILASGFTPKVIGCEVKSLIGDNAHGIETTNSSAIVEGNSVLTVGGRAYILPSGCSAKNNVGHPEELVFASSVISNSVTNTAVETDFNQTYTIPAHRLLVGDVIRIRGYVKVTAANATDTLLITVKLGGSNIASTGAIDVSAGDAGYFDLQLHIRAIGTSGTFVGTGLTGMGPPTNQTAPKIERRDATTIDTTQALIVKATALWSAANVGNACVLELFSVDLISYNSQ